MKNVKFEKPVFKHARQDLVEAMFGDLNEDASRIAKDECKKQDKLFLEAVAEIDEDDYSDSLAIDMAWDHAINAQHLSILLVTLGRFFEQKKNPISALMGILTGGKCDCPACKKRRNEES